MTERTYTDSLILTQELAQRRVTFSEALGKVSVVREAIGAGLLQTHMQDYRRFFHTKILHNNPFKQGYHISVGNPRYDQDVDPSAFWVNLHIDGHGYELDAQTESPVLVTRPHIGDYYLIDLHDPRYGKEQELRTRKRVISASGIPGNKEAVTAFARAADIAYKFTLPRL